MQEKKIELSFITAHLSELSEQEQQLVANAKSSLKTAYAPYSGFLVGASVLLENGEIINGSNQENVAYPSGLCAESLCSQRAEVPWERPHVRASPAREGAQGGGSRVHEPRGHVRSPWRHRCVAGGGEEWQRR